MLVFCYTPLVIVIQVVYNKYMATHYGLLALDNNMKTHQKHLQLLAIEMYKSKNIPILSFMGKTYNEKKIPIFMEKGYFPLNSRCKHSEIWNKFIKFQRKCFVQQPTNKV